MKKAISLIVVLVLCISMVLPVSAANFVPSITYKDGPTASGATVNGVNVSDSLVITTLKDVLGNSSNLTQEEKDLLESLHENLSSGGIKLPVSDNFVVRDLVHVDFGSDEELKEQVQSGKGTLNVTLNAGVGKNTVVKVLVYVEGEWKEMEAVNNGDGTISVEFSALGPVMICVDADSEIDPPKTGDNMGSDLVVWIAVMAVAMGAIVVLLINRRKFVR